MSWSLFETIHGLGDKNGHHVPKDGPQRKVSKTGTHRSSLRSGDSVYLLWHLRRAGEAPRMRVVRSFVPNVALTRCLRAGRRWI
jgi:hypothetical protein